jgi:CRP/FNR family transcriptional regulator
MLSREALRELELLESAADYDAGEILFLEQQPLPVVFVVLAGEVRLSLQEVGGRRLSFHVAKRGSVLGMHSALFGSLSECSAEVLYSARIASIKRSDFLRFAERYPEAYRLATMELVQTLTCACETLRIVGLSVCTRRRLALQLLAWGEQGRKSGDQTQYNLALTHTQIAESIGAVRESVTRALTVFKQRGLVEIRGSRLTIPSTAALRRYAESPQRR